MYARTAQVLVEQWAGIPLELTDIYGMRRYEDGARLLTHVDREETHAASLIINIAQIGMREPWFLEIYDFAGRLHEVAMEEGDIVYYAVRVHGCEHVVNCCNTMFMLVLIIMFVFHVRISLRSSPFHTPPIAVCEMPAWPYEGPPWRSLRQFVRTLSAGQ